MGAAGRFVGASLDCELPAAGTDGGSGAGHRTGAKFDDRECEHWSLRELARGTGSARASGVRG